MTTIKGVPDFQGFGLAEVSPMGQPKDDGHSHPTCVEGCQFWEGEAPQRPRNGVSGLGGPIPPGGREFDEHLSNTLNIAMDVYAPDDGISCASTSTRYPLPRVSWAGFGVGRGTRWP